MNLHQTWMATQALAEVAFLVLFALFVANLTFHSDPFSEHFGDLLIHKLIILGWHRLIIIKE